MLPTNQCFGPADPVVFQIKLRLESNPDVARIDCGVQFTHQRQFPGTVFVILAGVELHQLMIDRRIVRRQQGAANPGGNPARQVHIDPECGMNIDLAALNHKLDFDQLGKARQMLFQLIHRQLRSEPVDHVFGLVKGWCLARQCKAAGQLGDQIVFDRGRKTGTHGRIVADSQSNDRPFCGQRLFA